MAFTEFDASQWLVLIQHEALLFAACIFLLGALDDLAVDLAWLWLRLRGRAQTPTFERASLEGQQLSGMAAVLVPAWDEASIIASTIRQTLTAWPQPQMRLYVGCYANDPATIAAAMEAGLGDPRIRVVVHGANGPTTKADCLNRMFAAMRDDEARMGKRFKMILFHDAEDMVDPAALGLFDRTIGNAGQAADFVQMPVLPLPRQDSRWIGNHYCEEFAEEHGKTMVVRDRLGAALPAAGTGCAISRPAADWLIGRGSDGQPFQADSLTEDYELGIAIGEMGGNCRFLRARDEAGELIATRAYFPARIDQIVRQKTRWVHGIALQGWDRLGWNGGLIENWMRIRDRRGPMTALALFTAYTMLTVSALTWATAALGIPLHAPHDPLFELLLVLCLIALMWRAMWRFAFAARHYGYAEGLRAILRIPVANVIAIMAGRRAVSAYVRVLMGGKLHWDKTAHDLHPASVERAGVTQA